MEIPQLEPESKPMVFKVWSFDGADQITHPWMCQTEFGIKEFTHWDQAVDYALSLNPKPKPARLRKRRPRAGEPVFTYVNDIEFQGVVVWCLNDSVGITLPTGLVLSASLRDVFFL